MNEDIIDIGSEEDFFDGYEIVDLEEYEAMAEEMNDE